MSLNKSLHVVLGVKMKKDKFVENFGDPYFIQEEEENDLIAYDGKEVGNGDIIIGNEVACFSKYYNINKHGNIKHITDEVEEIKDKTIKQLKEKSIEEKPSLYLVIEVY